MSFFFWLLFHYVYLNHSKQTESLLLFTAEQNITGSQEDSEVIIEYDS